MKQLVIDIETAPNTGHVWSLWQQNIGLPQLLESGYVMCFAAKWVGDEKVQFYKGLQVPKAAHRLLSEADVVIGYNHVAFDLRHLQTEMARVGMSPPSPYQNIDLLQAVRKNFRFPSNKLEYVASELLGGHKAPTGGHSTWVKCMGGDKDAWKRMEIYNRADVVLTEQLFQYLKPWLKLANPALYGEQQPGPVTCPGCGSNDLVKRGLAYTSVSAYPRYCCKACGRWSRGQRRVVAVNAR